MMSYRITFYSPDRHILYDGDTPVEQGVGGGITSRIRMAEALAALGHAVTAVVNAPRRRTLRGVTYIPLDDCRQVTADVLVMNTSGGDIDLSPVAALDLDVRLRLVWISGYILPQGLEKSGFDFIYAKSNFLRQVAVEEWGIDKSQVFVCYNIFPKDLFDDAERSATQRDPFRLIYFSHPSKGLEASIQVLAHLRSRDPRFQLHIFGGEELWGQAAQPAPDVEGLVDHGLVGQKTLFKELFEATFALNLQNRLEPFGLVILEAMRAGCTVIASPVGAYPELIRHGWDGFLIPGDAQAETTQRAAASLISNLADHPDLLKLIGRNAQTVPWEPDRIARTWTHHWNQVLNRERGVSKSAGLPGFQCTDCQGALALYPDGYRCPDCGRYFRALAPLQMGDFDLHPQHSEA